MDKIILHIGYPKTASTWFQLKFYPFVNNYKYIRRWIAQSKILIPNPFEFNLEETQIFFRQNYIGNAVICDELLLGRLTPGGLNGFLTVEAAKRLHLLFPEAEIIIFLRRQPEMLASAYMQYLKAGGTYGIKRFLNHKGFNLDDYNKLVLLGFNYFLYHHVIALYDQLFGKEKVHIFFYEDFQLNQDVFLKKFAETFGMDIDIRALDMGPLNLSLRKGLILPMRVFNSFTRRGPLFKRYFFNVPYWHYYSRRLIMFLNRYRIFGRKLSAEKILGHKLYQYANEYYRESNRILLEEYGMKEIKDFNYPI